MANEILEAFAQVYADGPSSSAYEPKKSDIRSVIGGVIQTHIDLLSISVSNEAASRLLADADLIAADAALAAAIALVQTGVNPQTACDYATTANVNIATGLVNGSTHDGQVVATGKRILVWTNTAKTENGVYIIPAAGAATRAPDMNTGAPFIRAQIGVINGTLYGNAFFNCLNTVAPTLGATDINFVFSHKTPSFSALTAEVAAMTAELQAVSRSTQRIGTAGTPATNATTLAQGKWWFGEPAKVDSTISEFGIFMKIAGDVKIKVLSRNVDAFTDVSSFTYTAGSSGPLTLNKTHFGTINVAKGNYVGVYVNAGILCSPAGTVPYFGVTGADSSPATDSSEAANFDFQMYFKLEESINVPAYITTDRDATNAVDYRAKAAVEALSDIQYIGSAVTPVTGTQAGAGHFTLGAVAQDDGIVEEVQIFTIVPGPAEFFVERSNAAGLHTQVYKTLRVNLAAGLHTYPVNLPIKRGERPAVAATQAGWCSILTATNPGYFNTAYSTALAGSYTDAGINTATELQVQFKIRAVRRTKMLDTIGERFTQSQIVGVPGTLGGASNSSVGTFAINTPTKGKGVATKIVISAGATASVRVFMAKRTGNDIVRTKDLGTINVINAVDNTLYLDESMNAGELVCFQSATIGWCKYSSVTPSGTDYFSTTATTGDSFNDSTTATGVQLQVRVEFEYAGDGAIENIVTLQNMDRIVGFGPSYMANYYAPWKRGFWQKAFLHSPWVPSCFAFGGNTVADQLDDLRNNVDNFGTGIGPQDINCTYMLIMEGFNSAHGSFPVTFDEWAHDQRQILQTFRSMGAIPILSTEWKPVYHASAHVIQKTIAEESGSLFFDMIPDRQTFDSGTPYSPFWSNGVTAGTALTDVMHPGIRTGEIVAGPLEYEIKKLPRPGNVIKIMPRRPTFTVAAVDDLMFDTMEERAQRFDELGINQHALSTPEWMDKIENPSAGLYTRALYADQYFTLIAGGTIAITDYVLLDCTINATIKNCESFELRNIPAGVTAYVKDALAGGTYPADGLPVSKAVAVTVTDGILRLDRSALIGKLHFDTVSVILYKLGGFNLTLPEVHWFGSPGKPAYPNLVPAKRATGASIISQPLFVDATPTGWTVEGGAAVTSTSTSRQLPYNITRFFTVSPTLKLRQTLNYSIDNYEDREIEIDIWARWLTADVDPVAPYPGANVVTHETYNYRFLYVEIIEPGGTYIFKRKLRVGQWWNVKPGLRMRTILPIRVAACDIRIYADTDVIDIAKVDVRLV